MYEELSPEEMRLEVKRHFVLADVFKDIFNINGVGLDFLVAEYKSIKEKIWNLSEDNINGKIGTPDPIRLRRYNSFEWHYEDNVKLSEMGSWPKMDEFPIKPTTGNIVKTGKRVMKLSASERTEDVEKFLKKHKSITKWQNFITEKFPLILYPGGEVRKDEYNVWARRENEPLCEIFRYDIDNGNSRSLSYSIQEIKDVPCFYAVERQI